MKYIHESTDLRLPNLLGFLTLSFGIKMYNSVSSKMPFIISYIIQGYLGYIGSINTRKLMIVCTYKWLKNVY